MRNIPFYPLMVILVVGLGGYLGCDPNSIQVPPDTAATSPTGSVTDYSFAMPDRTNSTVMVGSFNMHFFGPTKLGKPWIMDRFADIIRRFDVVALQEITSKEQDALPQLIAKVNAFGARYAYTISPRIGREESGYYEQYAYVFDTTRVQSGPDYSYVVRDDLDVLHREPFVGRFQSLAGSASPFRFTLINIHTDPDEVATELDVLADVYRNVREFEYQFEEDDVMLLGDLNAAANELQMLGQLPGLVPLIVGMPTNTRKSKAMDNILIDEQATREFTGRAGTIDLESMFDITRTEALAISDHLPVWAEFTITEQTSSAMAGTGGPLRR